MQKNRVVTSVICILLMLMSIVIAIHYFRIYQSDTKAIGFLVMSLICFAEALFSGLSLIFCLQYRKSGFVLATYAISAILAVPILLVSAAWVLYFMGLQLLPPPQQ